MFNAPVQTTGRVQPDITGLRGQYAHGNEPSHHVSYLASTRERRSKLRKGSGTFAPTSTTLLRGFVRQRGLRSNERLVRVGAWACTRRAGSGELVLGSPLFDRAVVTSCPRGPHHFAAPKATTRRTSTSRVDRLDGHNPEEVLRIVCHHPTTSDRRHPRPHDVQDAGRPIWVKPENRPTSRWSSPDFVAVPGVEAPRTFQSEGAAFKLHTFSLKRC